MKRFIKFSFFIMLFFAASSAAGFIDMCHECHLDVLHASFLLKALSASGYVISIEFEGSCDHEIYQAECGSYILSIFHPPRIS